MVALTLQRVSNADKRKAAKAATMRRLREADALAPIACRIKGILETLAPIERRLILTALLNIEIEDDESVYQK